MLHRLRLDSGRWCSPHAELTRDVLRSLAWCVFLRSVLFVYPPAYQSADERQRYQTAGSPDDTAQSTRTGPRAHHKGVYWHVAPASRATQTSTAALAMSTTGAVTPEFS